MTPLEVAGIPVSWAWLVYIGALLLLLRQVKLWRFLLEVVLAIFLVGYGGSRVLQYLRPTPVKKASHGAKLQRFTFLDLNMWRYELRRLHTSLAGLDVSTAPINQGIEDILEFVITIFVNSWYTNLSQSEGFQNTLRNELKRVIMAATSRLAKVDLSELIFIEILPIINSHFKQFSSDALPSFGSYTMESKLKAVRSSGNALHIGVSLFANKQHNHDTEKEHLRQLVSKALPVLLSSKESQSLVVSLIIRELLASTILANVLEVLAEGDFINQMIIKFMGESLQRRSQVKRLRAALEQQTRRAESSEEGSTIAPSISGKFTQARYQHCLRYIKDAPNGDLETLRNRLELKLSLYSSTRDSEGNLVLDVIEQINKRLGNQDPSFDEVLSDPQLRSLFEKFLEERKEAHILRVYEAINELRNPLCGVELEGSPESLEFASPLNIKAIFQTLLEVHFPEGHILSVRDVSNGSFDGATLSDAKSELAKIRIEAHDKLVSSAYPAFLQHGDTDRSRHQNDTLQPGDLSVLQNDDSQLEADVTETSISHAVLEAVEKSLEQIIDTKSQISESPQTSRNQSSLNVRNLISPASSSNDLNLPANVNLRSGSFVGAKQSGIFDPLEANKLDSESDLSDVMMLSDGDDSGLSGSEILRAAPGDLSLAEKLASISNEIKNLRDQNEILLPLLKKAELTNNTSEIAILKRSKQGLEREIAAKELQRQHWIIQENENSLFGKSKIQISSYMSESKNGSEYVLYIVEVQKYSNDDPNEVTAGWVVARRFSQFYQLNEYLKKRSPKVSNIKFPKKSVLNFQKKHLLDIRKKGLEQYLQELLNIPEACSDPVLRSFLSSENFLFGSFKKPKNQFDDILGSLSIGSTTKEISKSQSEDLETNTEYLESIKEMQSELKQFDESQKHATAKLPFAKPISDLLIDVFELGSSKSWIRGRALLILLQQVLGSAIEKKIRSATRHIIHDEAIILNVITNLRDTVFPDGRFKDPPIIRSEALQDKTRDEARAIFEVYMDETCGKVFGSSNTKTRSRVIFELLQNDLLNKLLILHVLDKLMERVFT